MSDNLQASPPIKTGIQTQANLYSILERYLRIAAEKNAPLSGNDLYDFAEVQAIAISKQQVWSALDTLYRNPKKLLIRHTIPHDRSGNRRSRVGWTWNLEENASAPSPTRALLTPRTKTPLPVYEEFSLPTPSYPSLATTVEKAAEVSLAEGKKGEQKGEEIELTLGNTTILIGRNPLTNRIRISIEAL